MSAEYYAPTKAESRHGGSQRQINQPKNQHAETTRTRTRPQTTSPDQQDFQTRRGFDWFTALLLLLVWAGLVGGSVILLLLSRDTDTSYSSRNSYSRNYDFYGRARQVILWSGIPLLVTLIINELLVERCWRRITYFALGTPDVNESNDRLADNLRAANLTLFTFLWRAITFQACGREYATASSYLLVRVGTALAIASVQNAVSWMLSPDNEHWHANRQWEWVALPVVIHAICTFGSFVIWAERPWTFLSNKFDDPGYLGRYFPYLQRVQGGTLADVDEIIEHLTHGDSIERGVKTGIQFGSKLSGIWTGLVLMYVPTGFYILWRWSAYDESFGLGAVRMGAQLIFFVQNIFYAMAFDFIIWNISLDGFTRTNKGAPKRSLRGLGYSSGTTVLYKTVTQGRPARAIVFYILFWLQACCVRLLTTGYAFLPTLFYGRSAINQHSATQLSLTWLSLFFLTFIITIPLIIVWLCVPTSAPVCAADGWKWANIAKDALNAPGFYGVINDEAVWSAEAEPFLNHKNELMR